MNPRRKMVLHPADWDVLEAGEMAATERRLLRTSNVSRGWEERKNCRVSCKKWEFSILYFLKKSFY